MNFWSNFFFFFLYQFSLSSNENKCQNKCLRHLFWILVCSITQFKFSKRKNVNILWREEGCVLAEPPEPAFPGYTMFAPKAHKIIRNITQILKINEFLSNNFLVLLHVFIVKYKYRQVLLSTFAPKTRNNTHIWHVTLIFYVLCNFYWFFWKF